MQKLDRPSFCFSETSDTQSVFSVQQDGASQNRVSARAYVVFDRARNRILLQKSKHDPHEVASLTKIMTLLVALKAVKAFNLKKQMLYFKVTKEACSVKGTSAGLRENDQLTLEQLCYAMMLPSGNDAAMCIAQNIGALFCLAQKSSTTRRNLALDSVSNNDDFDFSAQTVSVRRCAMLCFIREMNLLAKTLNLYYTFFQNPHGLSESTNISCANDQLSLSLEALKNEYVQQIAATKTYTLKIPNERLGLREVTWNNTNRLLWRDGYVGLKTGITRGAGACLISQYIIRKNCRINTEELTKKTQPSILEKQKVNSKSFSTEIVAQQPSSVAQQEDLIIVVLGCDDAHKRFTETERLVAIAVDILRQENQLPV